MYLPLSSCHQGMFDGKKKKNKKNPKAAMKIYNFKNKQKNKPTPKQK